MKMLRKLFIKDYKNINDPKVREKHGILAAICGILTNLILFIFKLVIGIISFSMSIISDAFNNLTDLFSCFINLFGFKLANRPADKRHPYGHERIEYIAGLIIAFIIISVSIVIGYESINKLVSRENIANYSIYALIILSISIILKILLGLIYKSLGKAINSESLKASMVDSFNDSLCTTGVLIAAIINYFYVDLWWLDPAISLGLAVFIFYSGIKQVIETANPLIGISPDKELVSNIKTDILNHKEVLGIHDFTCHSYGHTKIFVTAHCEVDGYSNMLEIHDTIDNIETEIETKYGVELTIHMDPVDTKNKDIPILRNKIINILYPIDPCLTIHDLRIVDGPTHTNVLFDVLKDPDCSLDDEKLKEEIVSKVEALNPKYKVILKIDHKY